ncbi:MAG: DUF58 domain-containing protein [Halobacteriales archaeon]
MRATRRLWGVALLSTFLAGLAVLFERPVLLAGAASLAAWLLARQYRFFARLARTEEAIEIDQTLSRDQVSTGGSTAYTLSVSRPDPAALPLSVEAGPPLAATVEGDSRTVSLAPGQRSARLGLTLSWPVAGRFACEPATVEATDDAGLFAETLALGSTPSIAVEPRRPRNVHVGEGGEAVSAAYGEHEGGRTGSGFDPAELREYVEGDAASRIDWNATARLGEPYVREYESETEHRTALVVDHRAALGAGPEGATKLDYLRHVALAFVGSARQLSDPLGCFAVGDEGLTARHPPAATEESYARIRTTIEDPRVTSGEPEEATGSTGSRGREGASSTEIEGQRDPAAARRKAETLTGDDAFDATLRPFFAATGSYVRRLGGDALFETVRGEIGRLDGAVWTVVLTDDSHPERLREAVAVARRRENRVLVFLAPTVLFEPGELADLEAAYDRYLAFEEFRRDLARQPRVSAFEVAPGDRLDAVLASGRRRRDQQGARRA